VSSNLLDALVTEVGKILAPLRAAVEDPRVLDGLLAQIGTAGANAGGDSLAAALKAVADLKDQIEQLTAQPSFAGIAATLEAARTAFAALRGLSSAGGPAAAIEGLGVDLVNLLITIYLWNWHPLAHDVAVLATLIQPADEADPRPAVIATDGTVLRIPFQPESFRLDRLAALVRDPLAALRTEYGNPLATVADANAMADKLFPRILSVLRALGVTCRYGFDPADAPLLADSAPFVDHALIIYTSDRLVDAEVEAGVILTISSADRGDLGLVVSPFGVLAETFQIGNWTFEIGLTADVQGFAVGRNGLTLLASPNTAAVSGKFKATIPDPGTGPAFVFGSTTGSRLELGQPELSAQFDAASTGLDVALAAATGKSALVIAAGDGDGFLADILPAGGLRVTFDLGLAWGNKTGLTFRGSAGLDATLPVQLALGPLTLSAINVALMAQGDGSVTSEVSANAGVSLGPVHAAIERVGLTSTLTFPAAGGNLGVADLAFGFKPPTGLGVTLDAHGVVTGGGFLQYDPARQQYAGILQLSLHERLTLTAIGLLTTRMPDGRSGYSLLVFITAEGFQPIPLGFGFQLVGIGGLVGVHRTFDQGVLTAGLKTDTLGQLLFPRDPVGNAPALLAALGAAFPVERGSYLLGLLARITWFTPTLVQLDLALALKLGGATELLLLGRVSALLPTLDNDLLRLTMDAIGVLNFDAGTLAAEALLVNSRVAHQFPITGGAAVQARWGSGGQNGNGANFVMAVGGFNPRYMPPPGFPDLPRVAIALCSGDNPRLLCEGYFALTANTIQFGSRVALYAEAAGFRVTGDMGFDVLVQPLPFQFIADFHAAVQLKWKSYNLAKVALAGTLAGPVPLRLRAKATIEILWFSVSMQLDLTLNPAAALQAVAVAPVALEGLVAAALGAAANWRTAAGPAHGVALRRAGAGVALDPLGQLMVEQAVAPLNATRPVTTYGGAPVTGASQFAVTGALNSVAGTAVPGAFAPGRYFTLSDDEKLVSPSFETLDAGIVLGATGVTAGVGVSAPLIYRGLTFDAAPAGGTGAAPPPTQTTYSLPVAGLAAQRPSGAAARAQSQQVGRRRFGDAGAAAAAQFRPPEWRLVRVADGTVSAPVLAGTTSWSEMHATLTTLNRGGAAWQMVQAQELV